VFALTDEDIRSVGKVFGHAEDTMIASKNNFAQNFQALGQRVLELTA
jgi:hypothetical protein